MLVKNKTNKRNTICNNMLIVGLERHGPKKTIAFVFWYFVECTSNGPRFVLVIESWGRL